MDKEILVSAGHLFIEGLRGAGFPPRAALWVHLPDTDTWKFWILTNKALKDKREFYRRVAEIVSKHRPELGGIDAADVEMITDDNPVIQAMRQSRAFKITGRSAISVKNSVFNGYYLSEALILLMDIL